VWRRRPIFVDGDLVESLLTQISQASTDWSFAVLAYCFMPDHLHLLAGATAEHSDLVRFAHAIKQRTAYAYRKSSPAHLWQKGFYERVLRGGDSTTVVARYILRNPVAAGLCKQPREYPFAGSLVWSQEQLDAML
jgi:putative transposase